MNAPHDRPESGRATDADTRRERARVLRDRHVETTDGSLVLPNAWDVASTLVYETLGFDAVGTTSAGIAAASGVPDVEHRSRSEMLAVVERIAGSAGVPVSADVEAGYGDTPEEVAETVRRTIDAGAVGVNVEDRSDDPDGPILDVDEHAAKIRAARAAVEDAGVPIVINGRSDVCWRSVGEALRDEGSYRGLESAVPYGDLNELLSASLDRSRT